MSQPASADSSAYRQKVPLVPQNSHLSRNAWINSSLISQLNVPIGKVNEMLPRVVPHLAKLEVKHGAPLGTFRLVKQFHSRLGRGAVSFAAIAGNARTNNVFP